MHQVHELLVQEVPVDFRDSTLSARMLVSSLVFSLFGLSSMCAFDPINLVVENHTAG